MAIDVTSALIRALSFIAMFQAAGVAIFIAMLGRRFERSERPIRRFAFGSAIAGLILVSLHYALEAARMAGAWAGMFDPSLQQLVLASPLSIAASLRLVALVLIASTIRGPGSIRLGLGILGTLSIVVAFTFVGHMAAEEQPAWLAIALVMHLLVVAFWFGSLAPLYLVSRLERAARAARIVAAFTQVASVLVPGLFLMGLVLTLMLVDRWAVFGESYGLLLIAKIIGFALLMVLAALNKWRYGPALASQPVAMMGFQRAVAAEYVLICVVLIVTAVMTTFFSPSH